MICPKCGTENPDYFVYCKKCSERLPSDEPTPQQRVAAKVDSYSGFDPYTGVNVDKLLNEPYYDPRQRHNAIDPWDLLDKQSESQEEDRFSDRLDEILPPEREYRRRAARTPLDPDSVVTHAPRSVKEQQPTGAKPVVKGPTAKISVPVGQQASRSETAEHEQTASVPARAASQQSERRADRAEQEPVPTPQYLEEPAPESPLNSAIGGAGRETSEMPQPAPLRPRGSVSAPSGEDTLSMKGSGGTPPKRAMTDKEAENVLDGIFGDEGSSSEEGSPKITEIERVQRPGKLKKGRGSRAEADDDALIDGDLDDEPLIEGRPKKPVPSRSRKPENPSRHLPDSDNEDDEPKKPRSGMVFWIIIAVLAAALLFVSFKIVTQNYGSIGAAFTAWFGGSSEAPSSTESSVVIETTTHSGLEAHCITVYGDDGDTVVFVDPTTGEELKEATLENGGYKLTVVDLNWIPEEAGDLTTFDVTPVIYLLDSAGNRTDLTVPSFTVNVPEATVSITSPDVAAPITVDSGAASLTITGTVEADTPTRLFWGDQEYTSAIDTTTGAFTIDVPLTAGQTSYALKATLARHRDTEITVTLDEAAVSALNVTMDTLPSSVTEDTASVSGKTEAGAAVTVTGPVSGEVTVNSDGAFSFTADLADAGYGLIEYTVTAASGANTGTATFTLLHSPEIDEYSRHAQVFEYKTVLNNPNDSKGKVYRLDATVQSSEKLSDNHQVVVVNVDGDSDKPVTLDYFSNTELTVGNSYRFFADANGNTEATDTMPKMPRMNAWFAGRN